MEGSRGSAKEKQEPATPRRFPLQPSLFFSLPTRRYPGHFMAQVASDNSFKFAKGTPGGWETRLGQGKVNRRSWSFSFFFITRSLRYTSWGLIASNPGASGRRKSEARQQTLPDFVRRKNVKGKKRIVDRMFPITGEPENRKGVGVWHGWGKIWRGWGLEVGRDAAG